MVTSVRFFLSYDLLNESLSSSKIVYFNDNLPCHEKCYLTCVVYDMNLSTEQQYDKTQYYGHLSTG